MRVLAAVALALLCTDVHCTASGTQRYYAAKQYYAGELNGLALRYGTDKQMTQHSYTETYAALFPPAEYASGTSVQLTTTGVGCEPTCTLQRAPRTRDSVLRVLEIGVFFGSSIKMWRDYFPNAEIVGVDPFLGVHGNDRAFSNPTKFLDQWRQGKVGDRIRLSVTNQHNETQLQEMVHELRHGGQKAFDLMLDDGSHDHQDILQSWGWLWPLVAPGGIYVLEDTCTSYISGYDEPANGNETTSAVIRRFLAGDGIQSKYLTPKQARQLEEQIESATIVVPPRTTKDRSETTIVVKKH